MQLSHPAPGRRITSPYGWRTHPISGNRRHHNGTDYGGTFEVLAAGDGVVIKKGSNMDPNRGYGHSLTIKHDDGVVTLYAHGKKASKFNVGDKIKKGDVVYTSGATGAATGPHLHFEVRINGRFVDPEKHVNKEVNKPIPSTPTELPLVVVDGRLNKGTWRRIQTWLKKEWGYTGRIDGIAGRLTYSALQSFLRTHWGYKGRIDGSLERASWKAAQRWLKALHGYTGRIDGITGPLTNSALQRFANTVKKDGTLPEETINILPKPPTVSSLPEITVNGIMDTNTWIRLQTWLKKEWGYTGNIDGHGDRETWKAFQRFLKQDWGYPYSIDGIAGKGTITALQKWLKAKWDYEYAIDGIFGKGTTRALQRFAKTIEENGNANENNIVAKPVEETKPTPEPEVELSDELTVHGIDVSHWQGKIDYNAYKASGGEFVIIKHSGANIGRLYVSDSIDMHLNDARKAGLKIGFYYVVNGHMDIMQQAKFFVNNVKKIIQNGDIVVLDNESLDKGRAFTVQESIVWLNHVEKELNIKPFYYSYPALIKASDHTVIAENYPLWLAAFNKNNGTTEGGYERHMAYWTKPTIWQYTSNGRIEGYGSRIDKNLSVKGVFKKYGYKG